MLPTLKVKFSELSKEKEHAKIQENVTAYWKFCNGSRVYMISGVFTAPISFNEGRTRYGKCDNISSKILYKK